MQAVFREQCNFCGIVLLKLNHSKPRPKLLLCNHNHQHLTDVERRQPAKRSYSVAGHTVVLKDYCWYSLRQTRLKLGTAAVDSINADSFWLRDWKVFRLLKEQIQVNKIFQLKIFDYITYIKK